MLSWLTANWGVIAGVISALLLLAGLIVKLTETKKDDKWFDVIRRVLSLLPGVKSPEQKAGDKAAKIPMTTEAERDEDKQALKPADGKDKPEAPFRKSK